MNKELGQLNFFKGSQYIGCLYYVRLTNRGVRYACDWACCSDVYYDWTVAVLWRNGSKIAIFHRQTYSVECRNFVAD